MGAEMLLFFSLLTDSVLSRVWLFHCHIEWHMLKGMVATIIEAPDHLQDLHPPVNQLKICASYPSISELDRTSNYCTKSS